LLVEEIAEQTLPFQVLITSVGITSVILPPLINPMLTLMDSIQSSVKESVKDPIAQAQLLPL
jgi:hypothetical protein